jgi:hypothetical protein
VKTLFLNIYGLCLQTIFHSPSTSERKRKGTLLCIVGLWQADFIDVFENLIRQRYRLARWAPKLNHWKSVSQG